VQNLISRPVPAPTQAQLRKLFPKGRADVIAALASAGPALAKAGVLDNLFRLAMFVAQFGHETGGLCDLEEDLNYSAERLMVVWPTRFPTLAAARPYARNPQALAERAYGKRMGNIKPGDGWKYRGRGGGLTGLEAYQAVGRVTGQPFEAEPDLVATPAGAAASAIGVWTWKKLSPSADREDVSANTRLLNGGQIGLPARKTLYGLAKGILDAA
jgi:putative chitinase